MNRNKVVAVLVRDDSNKVVGVLTREDIVCYDRQRLEQLMEIARARGWSPRSVKNAGTGVHLRPEDEDIEGWITPGVLSVDKGASFMNVVKTMLKKKTGQVYVRDSHADRLVGVITTADLLKEMARRGSHGAKTSRRSGGKSRLAHWAAGFLLAFTFTVSAGAAGGRLAAVSSHLWLKGDSTLHPFVSTATVVQVEGEFAPAGNLAQAVPAGQVAKFEVTIPVEDLQSGESGLDKRMYKALKSEAFPDIHFALSKYEVVPSSSVIKAAGILSIAGVQKPVELNAALSFSGDRMEVRGEYTLLMTDYGITPPTLMLGAIKVAPAVTIHFDLSLTAKEEVQ